MGEQRRGPGAQSAPDEASAAVSTHLTEAGHAHMVNVASKPATLRRAVARGAVRMRAETVDRLRRHDTPKGEVLGTARLAGIMAAKRTPELIPLCHAIALTHLEVRCELAPSGDGVEVVATAEAVDRTGVEMEALVAVTTACLTIYDMLKGIDRAMSIVAVELVEKSGGRSGHFRREGSEDRGEGGR